jgi:hypothetical protein
MCGKDSMSGKCHSCVAPPVVALKDVLAKEENTILDWLCPSTIDPSHDQEERRNLKTKNTATWIFQNAKYKTWLGDSGSFLWLHGKSKHSHIS